MKNPWEEIPLAAYEGHMQLGCVMQLQALNEMMKGQLDAYPVSSVMILGVAGGNGLEHVAKQKFKKVYGVDINTHYLQQTLHRYPGLKGVLECLHVDLLKETGRLPPAELVIANLLIEYIGYACFQEAIRQVKPRFVSCILQMNAGDAWVSDSPYLHAFDGLEPIHHSIEKQALEKAMTEIGYHAVKALDYPLPNGKRLVQADFKRQP